MDSIDADALASGLSQNGIWNLARSEFLLKADGHALDIAVIGLGQAGGNLASEFYGRGYRALAFNTAKTDLESLEPGGVYPALPAERRFYIGLDGYDGAGADPSYGKECVTANGERIRETVLKELADADVVLLTAGLGGGTGSSVVEMINILKDDDLPLMALLTLPSESESGIAKVNAVRAINELVDAPLLGRIFVDNARIAGLHPDISIADYYPHINQQIATPLDSLNRLNSRADLTPIRSFDGEDFRKLLTSGGVLNFGIAKIPSISTEGVLASIRASIEASELMPCGFDMTQLSFMGIIFEASESVLAATPVSVIEEIDEQLKVLTGGGAVYKGIYRSKTEEHALVRLISATQSLPSRLRELLATAKREGGVLGEKIRTELSPLELGELESFDLFRAPTRVTLRPRRNVPDQVTMVGKDQPSEKKPNRRPLDPEEITRRDQSPANKVDEVRVISPQANPKRPSSPAVNGGGAQPGRPKRSVSGRHAGGPNGVNGAKRGPAAATLPDDAARTNGRLRSSSSIAATLARVNNEDSVVAKEPRARRRSPTPPPNAGELPNPEIYDRMVKEYLQAKGQRTRDEVARRLREDSKSRHTVVRYYAVEAMTKLDREAFGTALLAATQDENEAVRALAVQALRRA